MGKLGILMVLMAASVIGGMALADPSPNGPGQPGAPGVSCGFGNATVMPAGFSTGGFAHAGTVYAGSPGSASAEHANSPHAVSQYDIACFQMTQH